MRTGFFLHLAFEPLKVGEHFALLLHREYPRLSRVVVDEGVRRSSAFEPVPICPSVLRRGGPCLRSSPSQMGVDVFCRVGYDFH